MRVWYSFLPSTFSCSSMNPLTCPISFSTLLFFSRLFLSGFFFSVHHHFLFVSFVCPDLVFCIFLFPNSYDSFFLLSFIYVFLPTLSFVFESYSFTTYIAGQSSIGGALLSRQHSLNGIYSSSSNSHSNSNSNTGVPPLQPGMFCVLFLLLLLLL